MRIHACATFQAGTPSALHDIVRAFHLGDAAALDAVAGLVAEALRSGEVVPPAFRPGAVVVVPGHLPGSVNGPCVALAHRLAEEVGWPRPSTGALVRIAPAPEARSAVDRDPLAEVATLRWHPELLPATGTVLLLDDVVRTGSTLVAAAGAAPAGLAPRLEALAAFRAEGGGHRVR